MINILLASGGSLMFGATVGTAFGIKVRGLIPLRAPSNIVRLNNAGTDVEIAKFAVEKRKQELELEYIEIIGQKKILDEQNNMKAITESSQASETVSLSDTMFHAIVRFSKRQDAPHLPIYLQDALSKYAIKRNLVEFLYERV